MVNKTDDAVMAEEVNWQEKLSPEAFYVCRQKGTERPFSGEYDKFNEPGHYHCVACGQLLFSSEHKFDAGCGWPSFWQVAQEGLVNTYQDRSHGMIRTEVTCSGCESHLGHVFEDGPEPTGLRYCINSVALKHKPL
ncbi:MAG: peptide-methionine (R)-S-oxide reductase MsrB [Nitrincola sp.]|nr:peptide-methionine (R)-S-oxide reductase MsrB [Nitrincola sp.]